jgi:hypothetical protein
MSARQWEHTFEHANIWASIAERFGLGFLIYLPTDNALFANSWYIAVKYESISSLGSRRKRKLRGNGLWISWRLDCRK